MRKSDETEIRHMVPRWQSINASRIAGETASILPVKPQTIELQQRIYKQMLDQFEVEKFTFSNSPNIENAEEVISKAIFFNIHHDEIIGTAAQLLLDDESTHTTLRHFAQVILHGRHEDVHSPLPKIEANIRIEIARRKKFMLLNPRDSRLMGETALLHVNLGQLDKAQKLLEKALILAPNDRYLLRSAARFFIHSDDVEHAAWVLDNRPISKHDPWLAAALMACNNVIDGKLKNYKAIKNLARNENFSARTRSELQSEIATLELVSGANNRGGKWLQMSSIDPTENTIAQIEWASRKLMNDTNRFMETDFSISHEAAANKAYANADWIAALDSCELWLEYEPFSSRPAVFGTFIACLGGVDTHRGIMLAKKGILANPSADALYNNLAVLYAYTGDINQADEMLEKADKLLRFAIANRGADSTYLFIHDATRGLIEFRKGNIGNAVESYMKAIGIAAEKKQKTSCLRLLTFFCKEISLVDWQMSQEILEFIVDLNAKLEKKGQKIPRDISYTIEVLSDESKTLFQSAELNHVFNMKDDKMDLLKSLFEDTHEI
jgi:tetratricopeptide (TPR) repeat protein